ncbi:DUF551 domain-containing protein, partial [Achromobacter ruhlandii]|uniref:DUF551 domain-containing protein n=1 Tax=Achromobacter ruhlandii TaxID=72557 RepID=UPI000AA0DD59
MTTTIPAGWLPIESAPKDGRRVLLWNERYNAAITGQFYGLGGWKLDGEMPPLFHQPTHWMPLPAAPGVSTVKEKPAAYLTLDEDGSPCMLFFDVVEARAYCEIGEEPEALWRRPAPAAGDALTAAARDVLAERQRQISVEGWEPERDDTYRHGELA